MRDLKKTVVLMSGPLGESKSLIAYKLKNYLKWLGNEVVLFTPFITDRAADLPETSDIKKENLLKHFSYDEILDKINEWFADKKDGVFIYDMVGCDQPFRKKIFETLKANDYLVYFVETSSDKKIQEIVSKRLLEIMGFQKISKDLVKSLILIKDELLQKYIPIKKEEGLHYVSIHCHSDTRSSSSVSDGSIVFEIIKEYVTNFTVSNKKIFFVLNKFSSRDALQPLPPKGILFAKKVANFFKNKPLIVYSATEELNLDLFKILIDKVIPTPSHHILDHGFYLMAELDENKKHIDLSGLTREYILKNYYENPDACAREKELGLSTDIMPKHVAHLTILEAGKKLPIRFNYRALPPVHENIKEFRQRLSHLIKKTNNQTEDVVVVATEKVILSLISCFTNSTAKTRSKSGIFELSPSCEKYLSKFHKI